MNLIVDVEQYAREIPDVMPAWWHPYDGLVWPLDEQSIVFDVGGGSGVWAKGMLDTYGCHVYSFEPSPHFYEKMLNYIGQHPHYHPFPYGLGAANRTLPLHDYERDGASFLNEAVPMSVPAEIRDVAEAVGELGVEQIDVMGINIEGGEYELIPRLIETGLVAKVQHFMIQWHTFNTALYERLRYGIRAALAVTHQMIWNHIAYEAWEKK